MNNLLEKLRAYWQKGYYTPEQLEQLVQAGALTEEQRQELLHS